MCCLGCQVAQVVVSFIKRQQHQDTTGDPWDGRTLEWSTASPPPYYNFAHIPHVHCRDPFWEKKQEGSVAPPQRYYHDIHMPKHSAIGVYMGACSLVMGFAIIWHMFWLAAIGFAGLLTFAIIRLSDDDTDYYVPKDEVAEIESKTNHRNVFA